MCIGNAAAAAKIQNTTAVEAAAAAQSVCSTAVHSVHLAAMKEKKRKKDSLEVQKYEKRTEQHGGIWEHGSRDLGALESSRSVSFLYRSAGRSNEPDTTSELDSLDGVIWELLSTSMWPLVRQLLLLLLLGKDDSTMEKIRREEEKRGLSLLLLIPPLLRYITMHCVYYV